MEGIVIVKFLFPPFSIFLSCLFRFKENFQGMDEIPVEYNIIIEALSCAVQNQQQAEGNEGQTNFEFVVINNASDDQVQAQGQNTLQCIEQSEHQHEHVEAQVTFQDADDTSATTSNAPGAPTEGQNVETPQATEAIQPRAKAHKCDVCNKTFSYAGRKVLLTSRYF